MRRDAIERFTVLLVAAAFWVPACVPVEINSDEPEPEVDAVRCTMILVTVQFWVVDAAGYALKGFQLTVTNVRTGEVYNVEQYSNQDGQYTALHDGFRKQVYGDGDPIHVEGRDGWGRTFAADFFIGADRCHIHKVGGPDRIVVAG